MVETQLSGAFPRSEKLVEVTRAAIRGKTTQGEVDKALRQDITALAELQHEAQLSSSIDGQLDWQDLLRPFAELFTGIQASGLSRWFDNNTFYRKPIVTGKVVFKGTGLERYFHSELLPTSIARKAILPGPFTFATLCENRAYMTGSELMMDLAHALRDVVVALRKYGYEWFQFNEPAMCAKKVAEAELTAARQAFEVCAKGIEGKSILQTYFADVSSAMSSLLEFPVDTIGVDFYATPADALSGVDFDKSMGCGCIDGRNSLLESPEDLAKFVSRILDDVAPKNLFLSPNCDLDFLPRTIAEKKVRLLRATSSLV